MNTATIIKNQDVADDGKSDSRINLPLLLRSFGAAAVLFSLYNFLFKGWEGSTDLIRYTMLLGHTVLLAVIALGSGKILKEGKGPRLMMMLALVSVPVNYAILGAFVAFASAVTLSNEIPTYVYWSISDLPTALWTAAGASLLLIPVVLLAFRTLVRDLSKSMSGLFIVGNLLLLMPIRDELFASITAFALAAVTLLFSNQTRRKRTESKTFEGMIALLLLFLPAGIMLGRDLWLHNHDVSLVLATSLTAFIVLRHCGLFFADQRIIRTLLEWLSIGVALIAGLSIFGLAASSPSLWSMAFLAGTTLSAGLIYEIALRRKTATSPYRLIAFGILLVGVLCNLFFLGDLVSSAASFAIGLACIVLAHKQQERALLWTGGILLLAASIKQITHIYLWFDFSHWILMAVVGIAAILLASMLESRGERIKQSISNVKNNYAAWRF